MIAESAMKPKDRARFGRYGDDERPNGANQSCRFNSVAVPRKSCRSSARLTWICVDTPTLFFTNGRARSIARRLLRASRMPANVTVDAIHNVYGGRVGPMCKICKIGTI